MSSLKLSQLAGGRNNNFNLLRILAALAVLVSHSFPLTGSSDPLGGWVGMTGGNIAVDVFFVASGFLVTTSLVGRPSLAGFLIARALRVFPALVVMLVLTVFVLGAAVTTLPVHDYLRSHDTYHYLIKCATLFNGVEFHLPGVFEDNPMSRAVNGSLWSLPVEVRLYVLVALIWLSLAVLGRFRGRVFSGLTVILAVTAGFLVVSTHMKGETESAALRLIFMFFSGSAFFFLKPVVPMSGRILAALLAALIVAAFSPSVFHVAYMVFLSYLVLLVAYVPDGMIREYNRVGDYSYGVYIYAFPLQQTIVWLVPGISPMALFFAALPIVIALAMLSWHLLEKRALGWAWPQRTSLAKSLLE